MSAKNRELSIDIIKAFGIIFMVAGHSGFPFTHFISLFHMAIFFIASGYFYKDSNSADIQNVIQFIKRKFTSLWSVYVLWTTIFSLLHNFFIEINVYTDNPLILEYSKPTEYWSFTDMTKNIIMSFFMHAGTQMGGAFWFIVTLMELSIGYCIIGFIAKCLFRNNSKKVFVFQCLISAILLIMGFICHLLNRGFGGLDRVFSFYSLYHGGYVIKKFKLLNKEYKNNVHIAVLTASFIILFVCNSIGTIALAQNSYVNPAFLLVVSFAGWQFLYESSFFIQRLSGIKNLLALLGQNTMAVVVLHFLSFKIVSYIGVVINRQPLFLVAAFPVLYTSGAWWVAYTFVGLFVPVFLSIIWKNLKRINFVNGCVIRDGK